MHLIANKSFYLPGRRGMVKRDEEFSVPDDAGRVYLLTRIARELEPADVFPVKKRKYRRRDMRAED